MEQKPAFKPYWEQVKGNTWCMVLDYARIPVYLLPDGRAILMDSGYVRSLPDILALLEEKQLQPVALLTSHTHPDHVGCHDALREKFGAKVYMTGFASAASKDPLVMHVFLCGRVGYRAARDRLARSTYVDVKIPWEEGELTVEGATFRVVPTPGHCVEHLTFITPDNVAYLGDVLQSEDFMVNRRLTYTTGLEEDLLSKERIGNLNCDRYILAHNSVEDDVTETIKTAVEAMEYRLKVFEELAETPASEDELVRRFLVHTGADLSNVRSVRGVHSNAQAFISYLVDTGRLTDLVEDGYIKYVRTTK